MLWVTQGWLIYEVSGYKLLLGTAALAEAIPADPSRPIRRSGGRQDAALEESVSDPAVPYGAIVITLYHGGHLFSL